MKLFSYIFAFHLHIGWRELCGSRVPTYTLQMNWMNGCMMPNDIVSAVQAKYGSSTRVATARSNGHHQVLIFIHFQVLQFHMHHVGISKRPWGPFRGGAARICHHRG